ncbi:hypothetical protein Pmar_PMAR011104 [Perkinsus marinus ATCC 50983]|uniref:Uncharacterized protein n=1 Tax=Perkinsus marinus (strain ATCC 50983 / TXsc) TaxID=423536 RepID=C5KVQ3_PERM5|nr:hypothetical protein Pmar_PMAR011104 [Perkinsus marinus ATCC 50983]EER11438.1 hypothetical protein Pmar_PMAR011104 [Perkinsus marinus ATCC 50983]|eukprot:XP_002779643.1 hypothetical protein Pmar_PMAR011104 [Perkinsus marinus ATCC 50983]
MPSTDQQQQQEVGPEDFTDTDPETQAFRVPPNQMIREGMVPTDFQTQLISELDLGMTGKPTMGEYVIANPNDSFGSRDELLRILTAIRLAAKIVSREINKAGVSTQVLGLANNTNVQDLSIVFIMSLSSPPSPPDTILLHHHHSEGHEAAGPAIPAAPRLPQEEQLVVIPMMTTSERIPTPQRQVLPSRPRGPILPPAPTQQQPLMPTAAQMAAFMNERYLASLQQKYHQHPPSPTPKTEYHQPSIRADPPRQPQRQETIEFPVFTDPTDLAAKLFKDDGSFRRLHMGSRRRDSRCSLHRLLGRACKGRGTQVVTECEFKANYGVWTLAGLDRIKSLRSKGYTSAQIYSAVEAAAGIALPMLERLQYLEDAPGSRIAKALTLPGKAASGNAVKHHRGPTKAELMAIWAMLEVRHLNERASESAL